MLDCLALSAVTALTILFSVAVTVSVRQKPRHVSVTPEALATYLKIEIYDYYNRTQAGDHVDAYEFLDNLISRCPLESARKASSLDQFIEAINSHLATGKLIFSIAQLPDHVCDARLGTLVKTETLRVSDQAKGIDVKVFSMRSDGPLGIRGYYCYTTNFQQMNPGWTVRQGIFIDESLIELEAADIRALLNERSGRENHSRRNHARVH